MRSRARLIESYQPLVFKVAMHLRLREEIVMDMIQEGTVGLIEAVAALPQVTVVAVDPVAQPADLDQSSAADIGPWSDAPVTVEPASTEAAGSQNTLSNDDLGPAWSGPKSSGT